MILNAVAIMATASTVLKSFWCTCKCQNDLYNSVIIKNNIKVKVCVAGLNNTTVRLVKNCLLLMLVMFANF